MTARLTATLLAALRNWQISIEGGMLDHIQNDPDNQFRDHFADVDPLTLEEIDTLCEDINFGEIPVLRDTGLRFLHDTLSNLIEDPHRDLYAATILPLTADYLAAIAPRLQPVTPQPEESESQATPGEWTAYPPGQATDPSDHWEIEDEFGHTATVYGEGPEAAANARLMAAAPRLRDALHDTLSNLIEDPHRDLYAATILPLTADYLAAIAPRLQPVTPQPEESVEPELTEEENDREQEILDLARGKLPSGEDCVDEDAVISEGDDNGCYVAAWLWVDFSGTPFDKELPCTECGAPTDDGEGYDGLCGTCADKKEAADDEEESPDCTACTDGTCAWCQAEKQATA